MLIYLQQNHGRRQFTPLFLRKATSTGRRSDHYWSRREVVLVTIAYQYWSAQRPVLVHFTPSTAPTNSLKMSPFYSAIQPASISKKEADHLTWGEEWNEEIQEFSPNIWSIQNFVVPLQCKRERQTSPSKFEMRK